MASYPLTHQDLLFWVPNSCVIVTSERFSYHPDRKNRSSWNCFSANSAFSRGKRAGEWAKISKKADMVFRYFLKSSKLLIVFLDRSGLVLCRNKVWAIYIGRNSRNFKIKNGATRVHLTPERFYFGIVSMQLDRACVCVLVLFLFIRMIIGN